MKPFLKYNKNEFRRFLLFRPCLYQVSHSGIGHNAQSNAYLALVQAFYQI